MGKPIKPGKLKTLRPWFTVPEAAQYLALIFKEEVSEADVLRFALDGQLKLSVWFVQPTQAALYDPVQEAKERRLARRRAKAVAACETGVPPPPMNKRRMSETYVCLRNGPWDLPMTGRGRRDVENRYQQLTGGPAIDLDYFDDDSFNDPSDDPFGDRFDGVFVDGDNGARFQLHRPTEMDLVSDDLPTGLMLSGTIYLRCSRLPEGSVLVLRRAVLDEFAQRVSGTNTDRPLTDVEREKLLAIIWILFLELEFDPAHLRRAGDAIEKRGAYWKVPVSSRTVSTHLQEAKEVFGREVGPDSRRPAERSS